MAPIPIIAALDIGANTLGAGIARWQPKQRKLQILAQCQETSGDGSADIVMPMLVQMLRQLLRAGNLTPAALSGIGIAFGGPVDYAAQRPITPPNNLSGWDTVNPADILHKKLKLSKSIPIHMDNDANAIALAETIFGDAGGLGMVVGSTLSSGIGGGIIHNGRVMRGGFGLAGEYGHQKIRFTGQKYAKLVTIDDLLQRGRLSKYEKMSALIFAGINIVNILNPRVVICDGPFFQQVDWSNFHYRVKRGIIDTESYSDGRFMRCVKDKQEPQSVYLYAGNTLQGRCYFDDDPVRRSNANRFGRLIVHWGGTNYKGRHTVEQLASGNALKWHILRLCNSLGYSNTSHMLSMEARTDNVMTSKIFSNALPIEVDARKIFEACREGDDLARRLVDFSLRAFAIGAANVLNILAPDRYVIAGGITKSEDIVIPGIRKHLKQIMPDDFDASVIQRTALKDDMGLYSAFSVIVARLNNST
jgi:predicted NBD/HSP70 family sugar kinase